MGCKVCSGLRLSLLPYIKFYGSNDWILLLLLLNNVNNNDDDDDDDDDLF